LHNAPTKEQKFALEQGDQIGRIFAQWVIVYFRQLLENNGSVHVALTLEQFYSTAKFMH
jgi:hypothetical protein